MADRLIYEVKQQTKGEDGTMKGAAIVIKRDHDEGTWEWTVYLSVDGEVQNMHFFDNEFNAKSFADYWVTE